MTMLTSSQPETAAYCSSAEQKSFLVGNCSHNAACRRETFDPQLGRSVWFVNV